jgi:hypothetical protein
MPISIHGSSAAINGITPSAEPIAHRHVARIRDDADDFNLAAAACTVIACPIGLVPSK